jgi:hypothetical protein
VLLKVLQTFMDGSIPSFSTEGGQMTFIDALCAYIVLIIVVNILTFLNRTKIPLWIYVLSFVLFTVSYAVAAWLTM